jgi:hypothetical protein
VIFGRTEDVCYLLPGVESHVIAVIHTLPKPGKYENNMYKTGNI